MVDHSLARKRNFLASRNSPSADDSLADVVDDCVSRMLKRSGKIDSRREDTKTAATSSQRFPRQKPPCRDLQPPARPDDDVLRSLSRAIAQLSEELSELRNEQRILRTQIDEFHKVVLSDEV
jgi:vacuolar-type H+-ATPase subunit I/STV1